MIPGDLLSAFPHRQFHTLPGLLDSWAALPNSYPNALRAMQGGSLYHFYDGLWYDPAERRTHDLPCERRTRYRLSQPDTTKSARMSPSSHLGGRLQIFWTPQLSVIKFSSLTQTRNWYQFNTHAVDVLTTFTVVLKIFWELYKIAKNTHL